MRIVVAGVAGSGKSTVGATLAERLGARFLDGDSLHPDSNVTKMSAGQPLDDSDRWPWLDAIVRSARAEEHIVVACSALAIRYRDRLRQIPNVRFVFLDLSQAAAEARAESRPDHFMGAAMVASQFATLEAPRAQEIDLISVDGSAEIADTVDAIQLGLAELR